MSVDFYIAVPAAEWPSGASVEQCAGREGYPLKVVRFPSLDANKPVSDGAAVSVRGRDAYLEGEVSPARLAGDDVSVINERLAAAASAFRIDDRHVLMSVRVRSSEEMRAASYVIASLVTCFDGYAFEPQGNGHGRADFAKSLLDAVLTEER